ncbi:esterase/lipase family protein [Rhodocyclus tenuis]|uniref:esterase/lipase family protein n=1 Tax=Rhodocyclus tenuis TaxID=1066 RepID=UPI001904C9F0|nr:alpha/beta fold hydrolase [Rhodocyclus tenuis]MBK1679012.1 hypothetical protein [Rhodocyclus tenuis]
MGSKNENSQRLLPARLPAKPIRPAATADDLRGASQLLIDAVKGVTDIVEAMHATIVRVSPPVGEGPTGRTRGISGLVYRSVRGVTHAVGVGLDNALAGLAPLIGSSHSSPRREALLAVLNGVLGDYLVASGNPLAIPMQLRRNGQPLRLERQALAADCTPASPRLLVLVHGLCMGDLGWQRAGHEHGEALARDLGYSVLHLRYNSGQHISSNGREFATLLEQLVQAWPLPVDELVILGHSMGGLLARSAFHYAQQDGLKWPGLLRKLVFLGTPHHGSPLERAGSWVDLVLGLSPYSAPFARLGNIRSAGVKDLRHGNLLDEDWQRHTASAQHSAGHLRDRRTPVPLPAGVRCYAIAASKQAKPAAPGKRLAGDGLVPVSSGLGQHKEQALTLPIPATQLFIAYGLNHFELLSSDEVYAQLRRWLAEN